MIDFPVILAHGALGAWDELIFLGVAAVFVVMMVISWMSSRQIEDEDEQEATSTAPTASNLTGESSTTSDEGRFKLN